MCGCHDKQSKFWEVRNCKSAIGGLRYENGDHMAYGTAIVHIMRCLDDLEAALQQSCTGIGRCTQCGIMSPQGGTIFLLGARFCMECGTSKIESESEDKEMAEGIAYEIARQELGRHNGGQDGLSGSHKADDPLHSYWQRICVAAPEVGKAWLEMRARCS